MFFVKELIKFSVVRPYFFIKGRWFVWNLLNLPSRRLQEKNPLPLDPVQKNIVEALKKDGVFVLHIDDFMGPGQLPRLQAYAQELSPNAKTSEKKAFYQDLWDYSRFLLDEKNPFLQFSLSDRILAIANAYMGMFVRLHSLRLMKTREVPVGTPPEQSQLWHRDGGNPKYVKVFLYLNDVDEKTGPFIFLKGSQPGGRWETLFPRRNSYTPGSARITDEALAKAVPPEDILTCIGRAGTMVFVDTAGLHKGGYSVEGERMTMLATFFSKVSLTSVKSRKKFLFPSDFAEQQKRRSPQAQFAIEKLY